MATKKYEISVDWQVCAYAVVEAESVQDAINKVNEPDFPLPTDTEYIEGSFQVNQEMVEMMYPEEYNI